METYQIDRFIKRVIQLVQILFLSLKDIVMFVTWPVRRLAVNMTNVEVTRKLQQLQGQITEIRLHRLNDRDWDTNNPHKHDNYQSQIDMLTRKINECELSLECQAVRINHIDKEVKDQGSWILKSGKNRLEQLSDRINNQLELINDNEVESFQRVNKLEAKVDKILSENSKLTFKPLTKAEQVSLEIAKGEAKWHDDVDSHYEEMAKKYPDEPDFQAEQKAMAKQMAKVAKRDEEEWDGFVPYVDREENNK